MAEDSPFYEFLPKEFKKQFQDELEKQRKKERSGGGNSRGNREPIFDGQGSGVIMPLVQADRTKTQEAYKVPASS